MFSLSLALPPYISCHHRRSLFPPLLLLQLLPPRRPSVFPCVKRSLEQTLQTPKRRCQFFKREKQASRLSLSKAVSRKPAARRFGVG